MFRNVCVHVCGHTWERKGQELHALGREEWPTRPNNCSFKCSLEKVLCSPKSCEVAFFKQEKNPALYPLLLHLQTSGYSTSPVGPSKNSHQHPLIKCLQPPKSNIGEAFCINLLLSGHSFLSVPYAQPLFSPDTYSSFT